MTRISIDADLCTYCGLCGLACPMRLLRPNGDSPPEIVPYADEACVACGHCVAICPADAVRCGNITPENSPPTPTHPLPTFEQFADLVKFRRSIRNFRPDPVPQNRLDRLFDLIRWAPTAKNLLPVNWLVLNSRPRVERLVKIIVDGMRPIPELALLVEAFDAGFDPICRGTGCLLVGWTDATSEWTAYDSTIAAQILDLAAPLLGLGACWAGLVTRAAAMNPQVKAELNLPADARVGASLMIGVPNGEIYTRTPWRPECRVQILD